MDARNRRACHPGIAAQRFGGAGSVRQRKGRPAGMRKLYAPKIMLSARAHLLAVGVLLSALALVVSSLAAAAVSHHPAPGSIVTVAGNGHRGTGGERGPATRARLSDPFGVAVNAGNLFIANRGEFSSVIRKVTAAGTISTVAGNASQPWGYSGDGGPATSAQLNNPSAVAVDKAGNLYIADTDNNVIRKVSTTGIISTVAGHGVPGTGLLGYGISGYTGDGGPATHATLNSPTGVTVDKAGNLYIADTGNNVIRKVDHITGVITTAAGNGRASFSGDRGRATRASLRNPDSVTITSAGTLYIADTGNYRVRKVTARGTITTVAGNGAWVFVGRGGDGAPARNAVLSVPQGVAVDRAGNLYISDGGNSRVRKVNTAGTISTLAGNGRTGFGGDGGPATRAKLNGPAGVALDDAGNLYLADTGNQRVREIVAPRVNVTPLARAHARELKRSTTWVLDGSASRARAGRLVSYRWTLAGRLLGTGVSLRHVFARGRGYAVRLVVTDNHGASAFALLTVSYRRG
jgi:sugar lactone lactonase YvrE